MRNFLLKTFFRNKVVRVLVLDENGRLHDSYERVKHPLTVTIKKRGESFLMNREAVMVSTKDNIPTYLLNYKNAEPVDLHMFPETHYSMDDFDIAVNSHVAQDVYRATKKGLFADANLLTLVLIICGLFLLGYFMTVKLDNIEKIVTREPAPIVEVEEEPNFGG